MPYVSSRDSQPKERKEQLIQETILKKLRHQSEENQAQKLANKLNLAYKDLTISSIDPEVVQCIPEKLARKGGLAAIHKSGKSLRVGVLNPLNPDTKQILNQLQDKEGYTWHIIVISQSSLDRVLDAYKITARDNEITTSSERIVLSQEQLSDFEEGIKDIENLKNRITEIPTTEILNILIAGAIKTRSTDIHLEPTEQNIRLRYRIDGVLHEVTKLPLKVYSYIISRIKMVGKMKLNVVDMPQNGRFSITLADNSLDVRVSILPGSNGENIVMRILNQKIAPLSLDLLGFNPHGLAIIEKELSKPNGMILATGPTGSGKTTTLYAFLNKINEPGTKIITIEDPVEYHLEGISQTQVEAEKGYTFATALSAILRQDPDVIMVGEIRDPDTAKTAVQAALTGHIVFSTLHTNSAAGTIPRLIELDVKNTLMAPSINCIIGQRLLRVLCPHCKEEYRPSEPTLENIKKALSEISPKSQMTVPTKFDKFYRAKGCLKCNQIGYFGRTGIYEILTITPALEKLIMMSSSAYELTKLAVSEGMVTLTQDGLLKIISGETSIEELERVTGEIFSFDKNDKKVIAPAK